MAEAEGQTQPTEAPAARVEADTGPSILEQAIKATKQTERSRAEELL